jgi:hypothetical protein
VKRKIDSEKSYANAAGKQSSDSHAAEQRRLKLENMQVEVTKVSSLCDKISTAAGKYETERPLLEIIYAINNALRGIDTVQEGLIQESMSTCHQETSHDSSAGNTTMTDMAQLIPDYDAIFAMESQLEKINDTAMRKEMERYRYFDILNNEKMTPRF